MWASLGFAIYLFGERELWHSCEGLSIAAGSLGVCEGGMTTLFLVGVKQGLRKQAL